MFMKRLFIITILCSTLFLMAHSQDSIEAIEKVNITIQEDDFFLGLADIVDSINRISDKERAREVFKELFSTDYTWTPKLQKEANEGNAAALNAVGYCYEYGYGCTMDLSLAFDYYEQAAEAGSHKGMTNVGRFYEQGIVVEKDEKQAFLFYKKAALAGHEIAMNRLAQCYMRGIGTEVDYYKARAWFKKTADSRGDRVNIVNTGFLYYQIGDDYDNAFKYLSIGSEMGSPGATEWLAMCYAYGQGCKQDIPKAIELLNKVLTMPELINIPGEYDFIREKLEEFEKMR